MSPLAHPIDISIFVAFLVVTLVVGLRYGRQVKTIQDYALGSKNFATTTLVATSASGSALFIGIENTYTLGLYYMIPRLGQTIGKWLSGLLAVRMEGFLHHVSVAEAMGALYGKSVQVLTALCGIAAKTGMAALQFKVISQILTMLLGLENVSASIVAASIVIMYSAFGGIKAVTFTDVLQFLTFGAIIPLLALVIYNNVQHPTHVIATLANNPNFDLKKVVGWTPQHGTMLSLLVYFIIPHVYIPEQFQRFAMARDVRQAKHAQMYAAGAMLLIFLIMDWIAILIAH